MISLKTFNKMANLCGKLNSSDDSPSVPENTINLPKVEIEKQEIKDSENYVFGLKANYNTK